MLLNQFYNTFAHVDFVTIPPHSLFYVIFFFTLDLFSDNICSFAHMDRHTLNLTKILLSPALSDILVVISIIRHPGIRPLTSDLSHWLTVRAHWCRAEQSFSVHSLGAEWQTHVRYCGIDSIESFKKLRNAQVYANERQKNTRRCVKTVMSVISISKSANSAGGSGGFNA